MSRIKISAFIPAKCKLHVVLIATVAMRMVVVIPGNTDFCVVLIHSYFTLFQIRTLSFYHILTQLKNMKTSIYASKYCINKNVMVQGPGMAERGRGGGGGGEGEGVRNS